METAKSVNQRGSMHILTIAARAVSSKNDFSAVLLRMSTAVFKAFQAMPRINCQSAEFWDLAIGLAWQRSRFNTM